MHSSDGDSDTVADTVAVIDAALDSLAVLLPDSGTAALGVLQALERVQRRVTGLGYRLIRVVAEAPGEEFGGQRSRDVLADALRITPKEASARLFESADLTPGLTMTGQSVEPVLPATAGKVEAGVIGRDHVRVIRTFLRDLPTVVDYPTRVEAEKQLATVAVTVRPDQLRKVAVHLDAVLNPDGSLSDDRDRARKRGIRVGEQERDGMSRVTGYISPELRAYLETILAKYAAPGMCNPDDNTPAVDTAVRDGEVSDDRARRDQRTPTQRNHDALHAVLRAAIASGDLGRHRGLPVTVIVTTTLHDLETAAGTADTAPDTQGAVPGVYPPAGSNRSSAGPAALVPCLPVPGRSPGGNGGKATTAGGTLIPYRDLIRMASHAWHYLAVFDTHTEQPLYLGRSKRLASPDQRIVATARYGGCSFPACARPALDCEYHHTTTWAEGGCTDVTNLAPVCGHHHTLADQGWAVRGDPRGRIEWLPPAWLDPHRTPRTNTYHRPTHWYRHPRGHTNNTTNPTGTANSPPTT